MSVIDNSLPTGETVNKNTLGGIVAALGISIFAAVALPLVNVFDKLTPGELMVVRGGVSAVGFALFFPQARNLPSKKVFWFSFLFGLANFCLYKGIRAWGANPTIMLVTTTPILNVVAKRWRGQRVNISVLLSLALLLVGVSIALNPWETTFDLEGFLWSLAAPILVGIGFEIIGATKGVDPYYKSLWIGLLMVGVGLVTTVLEGTVPFMEQEWSQVYVLSLLAYGATGGFIYILANVIAFEKLKTEVASTLAMGETPAVIIGAYITLGETMSLIQWGGVAIAMLALFGLSAAEVKEATKNEQVT